MCICSFLKIRNGIVLRVLFLSSFFSRHTQYINVIATYSHHHFLKWIIKIIVHYNYHNGTFHSRSWFFFSLGKVFTNLFKWIYRDFLHLLNGRKVFHHMKVLSFIRSSVSNGHWFCSWFAINTDTLITNIFWKYLFVYLLFIVSCSDP